MSHVDLSYYETTFALLQFHKWSPRDVDDLLPWELSAYLGLLSNLLEKEKLERQQRQNNQ